MAETEVFERRLRAALVRRTDGGPTDFDALGFARLVAEHEPRRHGLGAVLGWRRAGVPRAAWVLLLVALLAALAIGTLGVGSQLQRRMPAVMPAIGQGYECPPGSTPDEPGPVDQARPAADAGSTLRAFDRRAGKVIVLWGGAGDPGTVVETWTFDVCTNTWTRMHPNREPPWRLGNLVYDADSNLTIGIHDKGWGYPPVVGNAWVYDLAANTWTERGQAPTDNLRFYDPVSGLVFGGDWNYDVETDTWIPAREAITQGLDCIICAYDMSVDRVIEYASVEDVRETRLHDLRTGAWSRSDAETPDCGISGWMVPPIVYDEAARRTVVTSGPSMCAYDATADRWEVLYSIDWNGLPQPTVYDPVNRRLLVFGYGGGPGTIVIGDIVAFDLVTREWTVLLETEDQRASDSN